MLHHSYPGSSRPIDYDEAEFTLSHKLGAGTISGGTYYRLRNQSGGHSGYWFADGRLPLGSLEGAKVALGLHGGLYRDPAASLNDYADQSIGLFATRGRAILGLGVSNSNLSRRSTTPRGARFGIEIYISFTRMFRRSH